MKTHDAFAPIRASQVTAFGGSTTAARVKPDAGPEVLKLMKSISLTATPHQIAGRLDEIERDHSHLFLTPSQQEEEIYHASLKASGNNSVFGVAKDDLKKFSPSERLALANSGGKILPTWYRIQNKKGAR